MNQPNSGIDHRPWGFYEVLYIGPDCKVKRILVYPGKCMSLQCHSHRSEHWFIIQGEGFITLDDKNLKLQKHESIDIPVKTLHRIHNIGTSDLIFIEIQTGDYFGEDDIVRLEDDFGRI